MIRGIRRRATFAALRTEGRRVRRRGLVIVYVPTETEATEVAFAISARSANAVRRNRCRRRLRAALVDLDRAGRLPGGAYLVTAQQHVIDAPQRDLAAGLEALLGDLHARRA